MGTAACAAVPLLAAVLWACGIAGARAQVGGYCAPMAALLQENAALSDEELAREMGKCEAEAVACVSELAATEAGGWVRQSPGYDDGFGVPGLRVPLAGVRTEGGARRRCADCAMAAVLGAHDMETGRSSVRACLLDPGEGGVLGSIVGWASGQVATVGEAAWRVLEKPENCFSCVVLLFVVGSVHAVGEAGFGVLAGVVAVIGVPVFLIWLSVKLGRHLLAPVPAQGGVEGGGAWPEILAGLSRFLVAATLVGASAAGSDRDRIYQWMVSRVVTPAVSVGMGVGGEVAAGVLAEGGPERSAFGYAAQRWQELYRSARARLPDGVRAAVGPDGPASEMGAEVMKLASALHLVGSLGMARGVGYMVDAGQGSSRSHALVAVFAGALMLLMFGIFMVFLAVRLVDPLLRLAVVLAVSPLLVLAWVFPATQVAAWTGLRTLVHAIAFFVVAGVLYGVALQMVVLSIVGPEGFGPGGLERFLQDLHTGRDSVGPFGQVNVVRPAVTLVMAMVALGLAGQVSQIASMFAGLQPQGGVAESVERSGQSFGMGAVALGWHGMIAAGGYAGRFLWGGGRRLFGRGGAVSPGSMG